MTVHLRARGWENFLFVTGLMDEAGVSWKASGGNVVRVPDDVFERLTAEQTAELARVVHNGIEVTDDPPSAPVADVTPPAASPGAADDTGAPPSVPAAPPRSGAGASRDAWAAYAEALGLDVPSTASRDDIITMTEQQEGDRVR